MARLSGHRANMVPDRSARPQGWGVILEEGFKWGGGEGIEVTFDLERKGRLLIFYTAVVPSYITSVKCPTRAEHVLFLGLAFKTLLAPTDFSSFISPLLPSPATLTLVFPAPHHLCISFKGFHLEMKMIQISKNKIKSPMISSRRGNHH